MALGDTQALPGGILFKAAALNIQVSPPYMSHGLSGVAWPAWVMGLSR